MATKLNMTLLLRRDDFTAEATKGYVLLAGEPGYCTASKTFKVGDGTTTWESLGFANQAQIEALIKVVDDKVTALDDTYATDEEVRVIKEALEASLKAINDELATYGDIVTRDASEFDEAGAAAAVASDLADYESANDTRVKAIEDEIDTFGDIVTRNASEFATADQGTKADAAAVKVDVDAAFEAVNNEVAAVREIAEAARTETEVDGQIDVKIEALKLGETYEPIGAEGRAKAYVDEKFTAANLDQYTTEQEVKDIVDGVISAAADDETYNSLTKLIDYVDAHKGEAIDMAEDIADHETRIGALETKPAVDITATQISNWDGEVGAKALAQGVKDVVDTNKATWDKAGTALQAADLNGYALETYVDQAEADAVAEAARDAATKYETIGTAQNIIDGLKLGETYEPIGAEGRAKSYTDTEIADFNTETVAPIAARVKAIEDAPYATTTNVATAKQEAIEAAAKDAADKAAVVLAEAQAYADSKEHKNTTYTVAPTANALEFTVTPSEGEAQTVKLVAPTIDVGVTKVTAGNDDIVVEPNTGDVVVSHKDYGSGTLTKDPAALETGDAYVFTGLDLSNGHVTGGAMKSLADILSAMEFIFDGGNAETK